MAISYEMNLDKVVTERTVYSYLDWVGDIGGLNDGLRIFFYLIASILNYNFYQSYLISHLFRIDENDPLNLSKKLNRRMTVSEKMRYGMRSNMSEHANKDLDYKKLYTFKMFFFGSLTKSCKNSLNQTRIHCLRRSLKYRLLEDGE